MGSMQIKQPIYSNKTQRTLHSLLSETGPYKQQLKTILQRTRQIQHAQALTEQYFKQHLPMFNPNQWRVINLKKDCLVLSFESSGLATRARYYSQPLLNSLRTHSALHHLNKIECKVRPAPPQKDEIQPSPKKISQQIQKQIQLCKKFINQAQLKKSL